MSLQPLAPGQLNELGFPYAGGGVLSRINAWQNDVSSSVHHGGVLQVDWTGTSNLAGGYTLIYPRRAILQDGPVTRILFNIKATNGTDTVKVKFFRRNTETSLYDFVAETPATTVVVGINTINLVSPITLSMGDVPGFYSSAATTTLYTISTPTYNNGTLFAEGDITTSNTGIVTGKQ